MDGSRRMRRLTRAAGVGVGTSGALAGVLLLGPLAATVLLVVVFTITWPLAAVVRQVAEEELYDSPFLVAALAAGGVLALPGLMRLLTWGATGLLVALVFALVFAVGELFRSLRRLPAPASERSEQPSPEQTVVDERLIASLQCPLSIEELCGLWWETTTTLAQGAGPRDRQAVAEVRRICLDEFERQNPIGFHRWLEAGAPGNPGAYLLPKPKPPD